MQYYVLNQTVQPSWPFASRNVSLESDNKQSVQPTYSDYKVKVEQDASNKPNKQIRVFGRVLIPSNLVRV